MDSNTLRRAVGSGRLQGVAFNKFTLAFEGGLEKKFLHKYFLDSLTQFRISFALLIFLYGIFGYLDRIAVVEHVRLFHFIRFGVVIPVLLTVLLLSFSRFFERVWQWLLFIAFFTGGVGITIMTIVAPDNYAYYAGMMLIFTAGYFFIKLRFFVATLAGLSMLLFFNVAAVFFSDVDGYIILTNNFFFVSANIIGMVAAYNIEYYTRRDFLLNRQLDQKREQIEEANRNLENKVHERTKELVAAKERAEQSDKLKSAFLANMSHEIRTPMNAILGFAGLLKEAENEEELDGFVAIIRENGQHLLGLISDIIDLSKVEAGALEAVDSEFSINELLNEVARTFTGDQQVVENGVDIRVESKLETERDMAILDRKRLKQVLLNLVSNAGKFTKQGYIEIGCRQQDEGLLFHVKDTGIGMSEKQQQHVFNRFMQVIDDHKPMHAGAGLGLAITKAIVNWFGGNIWVESKLGQGSIFYFTLPCEIAEKADVLFENSIKELDMEYNWSNKTILIAEDVAANYMLIERVLRKTGVNVLWAKNGLEAVEIFRSNGSIDLILMDIRMPEMNGFEAIEIIKKENPKIPVIAQTAYAMDGDAERSLEMGCSGYISKPIDFTQLIETLSNYLQSGND